VEPDRGISRNACPARGGRSGACARDLDRGPGSGRRRLHLVPDGDRHAGRTSWDRVAGFDAPRPLPGRSSRRRLCIGARPTARAPGAGTRARGRRRAYRRRHIHDHEIVCVRSSAFAALSTGESISLSPTRVIAGSSAIRCDRISAQCGSVKRGWAEGRSRCGERIAEARCARRSGVLSLGQLGGCSPEVGRRWPGAPR
jgi:hypothetical protein